MWIARQGVKAPLPKGWKAVHDPQQEELYYFNFETGESIWDHPCDIDYKNLVIEERRIVKLNGKANYHPSESKIQSLFGTMNMKSGTSKSTSTLSDVLNNVNKNKLKNDFVFANDYGIEFEEEIKQELEDDSETSWKKKSESDDSDDFRKPVDFGIDKETSIKLDKLSVVLMVGKEKEQNKSVNNGDSTSTSRDMLDSPTRNYIRSVLGASKDEDVRKSTKLDSLAEETDEPMAKNQTQNQEISKFKQETEKEFDQQRLELLKEKEAKINKLKLEIEADLSKTINMEKKRLEQDQEEKLKFLKNKLNSDFENEKQLMTKKHLEILNSMQKEYDDEKQLKKQKFSMQLSKYIKSGKSFDELDENEEKREIEVI